MQMVDVDEAEAADEAGHHEEGISEDDGEEEAIETSGAAQTSNTSLAGSTKRSFRESDECVEPEQQLIRQKPR